MNKLLRKFQLIFAAVFTVFGLSTAGLAHQVKVVAFGDSLTQGYGLPAEDGLVPQLDAWLNRVGLDKVTLVNAGVSGDTTAGGAARIAWTLDDSVDGIIVALGGNDLLRGLDPVESRANIETILKAAKEADVDVLLVGLEATSNYGADYKLAFDTLYPELAAEYDAILFENFFAGFDGAMPGEPEFAALMQADGIHPNAEGVSKIVAALGPAVVKLVGKIHR